MGTDTTDAAALRLQPTGRSITAIAPRIADGTSSDVGARTSNLWLDPQHVIAGQTTYIAGVILPGYPEVHQDHAREGV